jgi:putative DNA primase/helicase
MPETNQNTAAARQAWEDENNPVRKRLPCITCNTNSKRSENSDYCQACWDDRKAAKQKPNGKASVGYVKPRADGWHEHCGRFHPPCTEPGCPSPSDGCNSDPDVAVCHDHTLTAKINRERATKHAAEKAKETKAAEPKKGEFLFHTTDGEEANEKVSIIGIRMSDITARKQEWLWPDRIPAGCVGLFGGQPGCGKSAVALDIIARTTTGREWPDGLPNTLGPKQVILLASEDDEARTIKPRLIAAGARMENIIWVPRVMIENTQTSEKRKRQLQLAADVKRLKSALKAHPEVALVVLDPISAFFGSVDPNKDKEIRPVMEGIADAMEGAQCAFIGIIHNNKRGDADSISKILGASSVVGVARVVWGFSFDADDKTLRHMLLVKGNLSEKRSGMSYKLVDTPIKLDDDVDDHQPLCVWQGETDDDADDMLAKKRDRAKNPPQDSLSDKAEKLVREQLETGPKTAVFMYEFGKKNGIKDKTLKRAHVAIGGLCTKSKPYTWYLPDVSDNPDPDVQRWKTPIKLVPEAKLQDAEALLLLAS